MSLKDLLKKYKQLIESFLSLSVLNGVVSCIPVFVLPYVLRVVGPDNYGIYGFIYILIQYVLIFNNYGFDYSATKEIAQNRYDLACVNRIYNAVIGCRLLLFVAASLFFFALSFWLIPSFTQRCMFFGGLTLVLGNTFTAVWLFQGMEKMRYLTFVNVLGKLLFLLLVFIVIRKPEDYVYLPLLDGLGYMAGGISSLIIARWQFGMKLRVPAWTDMKARFVSGSAIFGSTLGITLYRKSNIFLLRFFVGDAALGLYTAAEKIITGVQGLFSPVSQALFPHLGHDFAGKTPKENIRTLRNVSLFMAIIFCVAMGLVFVFSDLITKILCGDAFKQTSLLLKIMSPVLFFGGMNYILGIVGLVNLNKSKYFLYSVLSAGIIGVAWVLCTASFMGAKAGSWAMTISETVLFLGCLYGIRRVRKVC